MARFLKKQSTNEIKPFGKLGFVGTKQIDNPRIDVFSFSPTELNYEQDISVDELAQYKLSNAVTWINVAGLHDTALIHQIGEIFELHPMVIDKITNTGDRPSFEDYDQNLVLVLKMLHLDKIDMTMRSEHILFVLSDNVLITFQENEQDPFGPIRERLSNSTNRLRKGKADYLLFALIRAVINQYTYSLEHIGQKIEGIEDEILDQQSNQLLEQLRDYNLEINYSAKLIRPAKEAIFALCKTDNELITQETSQYIINNVHDTMWIVADSCDSYRTMLRDQLNIYNTNVANRLNEMFRILTIFSVIFVPLTFIAGIYGMNFEFMPELDEPLGYLTVWLTMILLAGLMLYYFRRKKWL